MQAHSQNLATENSQLGGRRTAEDLTFDEYQRTRLVADVVAALPARPCDLRVLDVGGGAAELELLLPGLALHSVERPQYRRLPFRAGAFDVVLAADTLNRVEPLQREVFLNELARVAGRFVVVVNPFASAPVDVAEALLAEFLDGRPQSAAAWSSRSDALLPGRDETEATLAELGADWTRTVAHGNVDRWLALCVTTLLLEERPERAGVARELQRLYAERLYRGDVRGPGYRHALVAGFGADPAPDLDQLFEQGREDCGASVELMRLLRRW